MSANYYRRRHCFRAQWSPTINMHYAQISWKHSASRLPVCWLAGVVLFCVSLCGCDLERELASVCSTRTLEAFNFSNAIVFCNCLSETVRFGGQNFVLVGFFFFWWLLFCFQGWSMCECILHYITLHLGLLYLL